MREVPVINIFILDEYEFQYKQYCQYVHRRSNLLEIAAYDVYEHISDHSKKDTI